MVFYTTNTRAEIIGILVSILKFIYFCVYYIFLLYYIIIQFILNNEFHI